MKIYPAADEAYTHTSWEILVDIEEDVNDWAVRHDLLPPDTPEAYYKTNFNL